MPAAVRLLTRGLDLDPRIDVVPELGDALLISGDIARARAVLADGIESAKAAGDERIAARARLGELMIIGQIGPQAPLNDIVAEAEDIARTVERLGDRVGIAEAHSVVGRMRFFSGRARESEADCEKAAAIARAAGDRRQEAEALGWVAAAKRWGPSPASEAIAFYEQVLAEHHGFPLLESEILVWLGSCTAMQGRFDEARAHGRRASELFDEFGLAMRKGGLCTDLAYVELLAGDLVTAERIVREGYESLGSMGETGFRSTVGGVLANVLVLCGRDDEAERVADEVSAMADPQDFDPQVRVCHVRASLFARRGDLAAAEEAAREALAILEPTDYVEVAADTYATLAEVMRIAGRFDRATEAASRALALYEQKENAVMAGKVRAFLDELAVTSP
jgi:tetratricopeptide (TPR) repeat protein